MIQYIKDSGSGMDSIGMSYNANPALKIDDHASRIKGRQAMAAESTAKNEERFSGRARHPGTEYVAVDVQQGIQLTGLKEQEFLPYNARGTLKEINAKDGADSKVHVTVAGASKVKADEKQDQAAVVPEEQKKDDPQVQQEITLLRSIEEKVKAHEAAHKAAGGAITGAVSYSYTRGPDGKNYITGGEVPISVSPGKTPQETARRMQQVIQAALAPADPSPQDRAVAAQAATIAQNARQQESETETQTGVNAQADAEYGVDAIFKPVSEQSSTRSDNRKGASRVAGSQDYGGGTRQFSLYS